MTTAAIARPHDNLIPLLERKRMIDGAWIVCLLVVLAAVALLWFLRVLDIDLGRVAAWVFAYAMVHLVVASYSDRLTSVAALGASLRVMIVSSVIFLAFFWHLVGGLKHPMFLAAFTLPVIMSGILLADWQAHLTAAVSVVVVLIVSLAESPDLRWYVGRLNLPWLGPIAAGASAVLPTVEAFPDIDTGPAYAFALLETFAAVQFMVAFLSRPLSILLVRVNSRLEVSGKLLTEVQGLFHAVLCAEPAPAAILYADSFQIVQASDSFFKRMLVRPSEIVGKSLFDIVKFAQPDTVGAALAAPTGELPFCVYHVRDEMRIATLSSYRTEHQGLNYLYVGWQELTELYYLQTAFDALDDPLLVIGVDHRLHYANSNAKRLFGELYFGMNVMSVRRIADVLDTLAAADLTLEPDAAPRQVIAGQPYDIHRLTPRMPGHSEDCIIVWLHCAAREEALFEQAVRDPLTGAYNRRYFDDALAKHVATSKFGRKLACAYFDLDDFKPINDRLGHAAGDAALKGFVSTVKGQLRAVDILARLGGDEFAVLFINCDTDVAAAAISRIRALLTDPGWTFEDTSRPLGFSVGLAACHPDDDVQTFLERTDKAVYTAKRAGKGRTVVEP